MNMRHGTKARRAAGCALAAAALTVSLTACGSGDDGAKDDGASSSAPSGDKPKDDGGNTVPDTSQTLATINGSNGFQVVIHTAARDDGGFLTVSGTIKNTNSGDTQVPLQWNGQENQVKRTGRSLAGITLIDKGEKKRYYVLRDTDGFPLTTTGLARMDSNATENFFAQFPAPPDGTSEVDIQVPLMPNATIEIS
ncbi:hypothetical protein P3L51_35835 [Streptomyces sp. PSRA5]|uniref:hypothetical protein n=1 Tax=Streptomyces panacea TaxID=3035064 RepID=UPI00339BB0C7